MYNVSGPVEVPAPACTPLVHWFWGAGGVCVHSAQCCCLWAEELPVCWPGW